MTGSVGPGLRMAGTGRPPPTQGMAGDSMAVAGWTVASRFTGFIRVTVIAAVLGPTFFGNLFEATNLLPNLAFELLTGPLIAALLVPPLVRMIDAGDASKEEHLAGGFLGVITVVFVGATAIVIAAGPLVLGLLTILVPDAAVRADQLDVGWPLLAMLMPQALFYAIAATGAAVQNAHGRFALAAAAPAVENLIIIGVVVLSAALFGTGIEVDRVTLPHLLLLGLGTTLGVVLHAAFQWWGARRVGVALIPRAGWSNPEVRKIMRLGIPSTGFAGMTAGRTIGLLVVAGSIPGGVIAFQLGRYFFNFPVAIGARPVMAAQLPRLSRSFIERDDNSFRVTYRRGVDLILFVVLPAALLMLAFAEPLARAVAYGEMVSALTLATVSIATLSLGVVGESLFLAATSAFYARQDARTPALAMLVRLLLTGAGMAIAIGVGGPPVLVLAILGASVTVSDLATGLWLHRALDGRLSAAEDQDSAWLANLGVATLAVALGAAAAAVLPSAGSIADAALAAGVVVVAYLAAQRVRHSRELDELVGVFRRSPDG